MVYVNQIKLESKGLDSNTKFLELMYSADLEGVIKRFDFLKCSESISRQRDKGMTLDRFLKELTSETYFLLQLASPNPFEIRYCASYHDKEWIRKDLFIDCNYTDKNFEIISNLYFQAFNINLENEPVPKGILDYYFKRLRFKV